jgi:hypothetical protein
LVFFGFFGSYDAVQAMVTVAKQSRLRKVWRMRWKMGNYNSLLERETRRRESEGSINEDI